MKDRRTVRLTLFPFKWASIDYDYERKSQKGKDKTISGSNVASSSLQATYRFKGIVPEI